MRILHLKRRYPPEVTHRLRYYFFGFNIEFPRLGQPEVIEDSRDWKVYLSSIVDGALIFDNSKGA